eukprot:CAMPEP_0179062886 /NCGR_PEP_ID=MMETSP0796-20121207/27152_1 /TAXON_ID=73915 /ORGANISM="Pyrodinium bahamense, Strain pbaha01" /LENGTH=157 /DNA_ID=CAMNT_0020759793 /DNA_START=1 /DNA_END=475 /DNA_ORIENTATION=+
MQALQSTLVRYGKVGVGVHFCFSTISIGCCYTAISWHLPVTRFFQFVGLSAALANGESEDTGGDALSKSATVGGTAAMAFVLHKALFPLRAPVTVITTPLVAAFCQGGREDGHRLAAVVAFAVEMRASSTGQRLPEQLPVARSVACRRLCRAPELQH